MSSNENATVHQVEETIVDNLSGGWSRDSGRAEDNTGQILGYQVFELDVREKRRLVISNAPSIDTTSIAEVEPAGVPNPANIDIDIAKLVGQFPSLAQYQNFPSGSVDARLVGMLSGCVLRGRVPRLQTDSRTINRSFFAKKMKANRSTIDSRASIFVAYEAVLSLAEPNEEIPSAAFGVDYDLDVADLDEAARSVLALYPGLRKHQFYMHGRPAKSVVAELNRQIVEGQISWSRNGKLNKLEVSKATGKSQTQMQSYVSIFSDYEMALGKQDSTLYYKIPAMEAWLDESIAEGTLQLAEGRLNRVQLLNKFGMHDSTSLSKYPRLQELCDRYDALIKATNYFPKEVAEKLRKLEAYLASEVRGKGTQLSRNALMSAVGLTVAACNRPPFRDAILEQEKVYREAILNDPLNFHADPRIYKFHYIVKEIGWPEIFALKVKQSFERHYRTKGREVKSYYAILKDAFEFIAGELSSSAVGFKDAVCNNVPVRFLAREWAIVTLDFRDALAERTPNDMTLKTRLTAANSVFRNLANDGVLPPLDLPLIMPRADSRNHLRSVAEVSPIPKLQKNKKKSKDVDEYLHFAVSMLEQAARTHEVEINADEGDGFNAVLREELTKEPISPEDNPAVLIQRVIDRRLKLIEQAALTVVERDRIRLERGSALLAMGRDPGADLDVVFGRGQINEHERKAVLRRWFPNDEDRREQGLANLLKVCATRYRYLYPKALMPGAEGQFFHHRAAEFGKQDVLQSYLTPSNAAVAAVLILYILESGSNIAVGRTLDLECIETTDEPHHSKITGFKARARGKPIYSILPDKGHAVTAMRWLQGVTKDYRCYADGDGATSFFISRVRKTGFRVLDENTFREEFKKIISTVPELAGLPITPNMLRPSVLLKSVLAADGRTRMSLALGQHGKTVNKGYIDKFPTRFLHDTDIRRFMHSMETVVISRVEEAHAFLGITPEGFEERVQAVMRTGLGTMCANRQGRPGSEGAACTSIDCWNDCPQLIVIACKEDMAILQIWQHSLRAVEGDWIRDRPERWGEVWLPWLCFVDAVEVKMRQSVHVNVWMEAKQLAEQIKAQPDFQPMRLF